MVRKSGDIGKERALYIYWSFLETTIIAGETVARTPHTAPGQLRTAPRTR